MRVFVILALILALAMPSMALSGGCDALAALIMRQVTLEERLYVLRDRLPENYSRLAIWDVERKLREIEARIDRYCLEKIGWSLQQGDIR